MIGPEDIDAIKYRLAALGFPGSSIENIMDFYLPEGAERVLEEKYEANKGLDYVISVPEAFERFWDGDERQERATKIVVLFLDDEWNRVTYAQADIKRMEEAGMGRDEAISEYCRELGLNMIVPDALRKAFEEYPAARREDEILAAVA